VDKETREEMIGVHEYFLKPLMELHEVKFPFPHMKLTSSLNDSAKMMATNDRVAISMNFERVSYILIYFINLLLLQLLRLLFGKLSFLFLLNLKPLLGSRRS
jgi:hypothetical protein